MSISLVADFEFQQLDNGIELQLHGNERRHTQSQSVLGRLYGVRFTCLDSAATVPRVEVSERHSILDLRPKRAGRLLRWPRLGADAGERYGADDGYMDL